MGRVFHQLYFHLVWATKNRAPQLVPGLRPALCEVIREACQRLECRLHAVNAVVDHVHVALEIPPARSISSVVGQLKGASAHAANQVRPGSVQWQEGYGVLTFRQSDLGKVVSYITTQDERHRAGSLSPLLETCQPPEVGPGEV